LATRSGLDDATALRIVRTLVARGLVERTGSRQYRSRMRLSTRRCYTIGYAAQSKEFAFSREVTESVAWAAENQQINLVCVDNRYTRATAIGNARSLIRRNVDLVIGAPVS
jgi:DNA-binding IclR family transcriptional regulator